MDDRLRRIETKHHGARSAHEIDGLEVNKMETLYSEHYDVKTGESRVMTEEEINEINAFVEHTYGVLSPDNGLAITTSK